MTASAIAERVDSARVRLVDMAVSIPAWAWLSLLVLASTAARFLLTFADDGPWIFQDEAVHWELARSFAENGSFSIRDVPGREGFGPIYPILLSPAAAVFDNTTNAYVAAKGINALLMSLAAVPAYFLARRVAGTGLSLLAAALTVAVPGLVYTASIMTENAFYPLIVLFALALVMALERPTALRQLAVFAVIALAFYTRPHAAILVPVVLLAIVLLVLRDAAAERFRPRALARAAAPYAVTWLIVTAAVIGAIALQAARGRSLNELLGNASGVTGFTFSPGAISRWFLYHLANLDLSVGLVPFAALIVIWLLAFRVGRESRSLLVLAAVSFSLVFWFTLTAAVYAAQPLGDRIQDRYLFHVVPLLFVALVAWLARGLPRPVWAMGPAIAAMSALPAAIPYERFLNEMITHSTFSLAPFWSLRDRLGLAPGDVDVAVLLGAIAAGVLVAMLPSRYALLLPAVVLAYLALAQAPLDGRTAEAARGAVKYAIEARTSPTSETLDRSWIDRLVGRDAEVAWIWSSGVPVLLWETEFFNDSVGSVYTLAGPVDSLPQQAAVPDGDGTLRDSDGTVVEATYAAAARGVELDGEAVGRDDVVGTTVYKVDGPIVVDRRVDGVYRDTWSGPEVQLTQYACEGGTLHILMTSDPVLHPAPQIVVARVDGAEVAQATLPVGTANYDFAVPLTDVDGSCTVDLSISPTASPADNLGTADTRQLGVRFVDVRIESSP